MVAERRSEPQPSFATSSTLGEDDPSGRDDDLKTIEDVLAARLSLLIRRVMGARTGTRSGRRVMAECIRCAGYRGASRRLPGGARGGAGVGSGDALQCILQYGRGGDLRLERCGACGRYFVRRRVRSRALSVFPMSTVNTPEREEMRETSLVDGIDYLVRAGACPSCYRSLVFRGGVWMVLEDSSSGGSGEVDLESADAFRAGDAVIWWRAVPRSRSVSGVAAVVLATRRRRVTIRVTNNGRQSVEDVSPRVLEHTRRGFY